MSENSENFAINRTVESLDDCHFYHTMELPSDGVVEGEWDLRGREKEYLNNVEFNGKRVLEIGTASGHLCFWMERQGASVVGYDLSENHAWDVVPYSYIDYEDRIENRKGHIRKLNNSWWYARNRFDSKAQVIYGTVYDISPTLGTFDIVTLGSILLHLRDPFLALQRAASVAKDTLIVTDRPLSKRDQAMAEVLRGGRVVEFIPNASGAGEWETWWHISPQFIIEVMRILGFSDIQFSSHQQLYEKQERELYTIVGRRTERSDVSQEAGFNGALISDKDEAYSQALEAVPAKHIVKYLMRKLIRKFS